MGNKIAPFGSNFIPFRVDSFQKALSVQQSKQEVRQFVSLVQKAENLPST